MVHAGLKGINLFLYKKGPNILSPKKLHFESQINAGYFTLCWSIFHNLPNDLRMSFKVWLNCTSSELCVNCIMCPLLYVHKNFNSRHHIVLILCHIFGLLTTGAWNKSVYLCMVAFCRTLWWKGCLSGRAPVLNLSVHMLLAFWQQLWSAKSLQPQQVKQMANWFVIDQHLSETWM